MTVTAALVWRVPLPSAPAHEEGGTAAVDGAGRTIAWSGDWEAGPWVYLVDAPTGTVLHREECATTELFATGDGFVTLDEGWRPDGRAGKRLMTFRRTDAGLFVDRRSVPTGSSLIGVAPQGDRVIARSRGGRLELLSWPDAATLGGWGWRWHSTGVDWAAGCVWGMPGDQGLSFAALDGSWTSTLDLRPAWHQNVEGVGDGVLRLGRWGIRLFRPRGRVLTVLPPTSQWLRWVNVTDGGRTVRAECPLRVSVPAAGPLGAAGLAGRQPAARHPVAPRLLRTGVVDHHPALCPVIMQICTLGGPTNDHRNSGWVGGPAQDAIASAATGSLSRSNRVHRAASSVSSIFVAARPSAKTHRSQPRLGSCAQGTGP